MTNTDPADGEGPPTLLEGVVLTPIVKEPPPAPPESGVTSVPLDGATPVPPDASVALEPEPALEPKPAGGLESEPEPVPLGVAPTVTPPPVVEGVVLPTLFGLPPLPFPLPLLSLKFWWMEELLT